jgi:hypothetical protein
VTLAGTNFVLGGTAVAFGGVPATGVVVTAANSLTCLTPPGAGAVTVSATTGGGTGMLPGGFTYHPAPTLTSVGPGRVGTAGGRAITLAGTGFTANAPGVNDVTIGGVPASGVVTVDDATITCDTPPGVPGDVDVVVTNANGVATLVNGLEYVTPVLWAATTGHTQGLVGSFGTVNPTSGVVTPVGPTISLTALAFDEASGVLYALDTPFAAQALHTLNPGTGLTTRIGALGAPNNVGDLTFAGATLLGNVWGNGLHSLNTGTGMATLIGLNGASQGQGIAADWNGEVKAVFGAGPPTLHVVDTGSGAVLAGPALAGLGPLSRIAAMTWHDGVLFAVENTTPGLTVTPTPCNLVTIDTVTGLTTLVGPLPNDVDALASNVR